jgi:hypothetical protein
MSNWLKELLEEKSILWWFSVSTIMLFIFLIFVNQSSEKDLLGFLTESTFYVIEKEQDALEVGEEKVDLPVIEIEEKKEEKKDDVVENMVRIIEEKEALWSFDEDKEYSLKEIVNNEEDLDKTKDLFLPRLASILNKALNFENCVQDMTIAIGLSDDTLKDLVDNKVNEVCSEATIRNGKLKKDLDNIDKVTTIESFFSLFDKFFIDLESSSDSFNRFINSETEKLIALVAEELKNIEKEKYTIKMVEGTSGELDCTDIDGLSIFGYSNGKYIFIGSISNNEDSNSIANSSGLGSKLKPLSIMNSSGVYGSSDGDFSAFSKNSANPPVIVDKDYNFIGYITINQTKEPSVTPYKALFCAQDSIKYSLPGHKDISLFKW